MHYLTYIMYKDSVFVSKVNYNINIINRYTIYPLQADKSNFSSFDQNNYHHYNVFYLSQFLKIFTCHKTVITMSILKYIYIVISKTIIINVIPIEVYKYTQVKYYYIILYYIIYIGKHYNYILLKWP